VGYDAVLIDSFWRFGRAYCSRLQFSLRWDCKLEEEMFTDISSTRLTFSWTTLKIDAANSAETSAVNYQPVLRHMGGTRWRSWLRHCATMFDSRWCHWNFWLT